jgi:hypothetical protein
MRCAAKRAGASASHAYQQPTNGAGQLRMFAMRMKIRAAVADCPICA